jgi:protein-L-isoaspartate(D-aspartate) O-methyltransferase
VIISALAGAKKTGCAAPGRALQSQRYLGSTTENAISADVPWLRQLRDVLVLDKVTESDVFWCYFYDMDAVDEVFRTVRREEFLIPDQTDNAAIDAPLPIGFGQTNSQPTTVSMMLKWLEVEPGNKILDVGSGSGWTTALLSQLTGPSGKVYAVEIVPELVSFGQENVRRAGITNARFYQARKEYGLARFGPFDRILVSASANKLPTELVDQLKPGGKMVIPVGYDVLELEKSANGEIDIFTHSGFIFVPLIKPA